MAVPCMGLQTSLYIEGGSCWALINDVVLVYYFFFLS